MVLFRVPLSISSDVDECKGSRPACEGHGCLNLLGTFRCECQPGFIFNSISKVCEGGLVLVMCKRNEMSDVSVGLID